MKNQTFVSTARITRAACQFLASNPEGDLSDWLESKSPKGTLFVKNGYCAAHEAVQVEVSFEGGKRHVTHTLVVLPLPKDDEEEIKFTRRDSGGYPLSA